MDKIDKKTLFIIGAGFSVPLGLPTTEVLNNIISVLCQKGRTIDERLKEIQTSGIEFDDVFKKDIKNTLLFLLDDDNKRESEARKQRKQAIDTFIEEYKKVYPKLNVYKIKHRLEYDILTEIDWLALKSLYNTFSKEGVDFHLIDLLTIVQKAINDGVPIPTTDIFEYAKTKKLYYNDIGRLQKALNAYKYILFKIFKHILRINKEKLKQQKHIYYSFFYELINKTTNEDVYWLNKEEIDKEEFYLSNLAFLSFNWDPIITFLLMKTNQKINRENFSVGNQADPKFQVYVDFSIPLPLIKFNKEQILYSFSKESSFIINNFSKERKRQCSLTTKVIRLFLPHGLFNIRICPRCKTAFMFFPKDIGKFEMEDLDEIFLLDPIPSEYDMEKSHNFKVVESSYSDGEPDKIHCPSCKHETYFTDSFMEIQSILKPTNTTIVNKIQFDYANFFGNADHIIALGYSFPKDDMINNYQIKIMSVQKGELNLPKITVINYDRGLQDKVWYKDIKFLKNYFLHKENTWQLQTLESLQKLTESKKVRINYMGFPNVLNKVSLEDILNFK